MARATVGISPAHSRGRLPVVEQGSAALQGCGCELPQGQLAGLLPMAWLEKLIVQVGQRGTSGLFCWSLLTERRAGPGGWGGAGDGPLERPPHASSSREAGPPRDPTRLWQRDSRQGGPELRVLSRI